MACCGGGGNTVLLVKRAAKDVVYTVKKTPVPRKPSKPIPTRPANHLDKYRA